MKYLKKLRAQYADQIIAVSNAVAQTLHQNCSYPKEKVVVVTNGVDAAQFTFDLSLRQGFRDCHRLPQDAFVFGMVTRLTREKGVDVAIAAFAEHLAASGGNLRLLIAGSGPEMDRYRRLVTSLSLEEKVVFTGFVENTRNALAAIDCIVLPSRTEGLPLALLEGMAAGCIPIVTNVGAMPEVVGEHGFVVETGRVDAVAGAMGKVLQLSQEDLSRLKRQVIMKVRENYDGRKTFKRLADIILGTA